MDYLDSKKQFRHRVILMVGYVCVGVAIVIATLVLVYQAYGFGLGKNGTVVQSGLAFFSSHPNPADIYVDGVLNKTKTNSRLVLPANIYHIQLKRDGYRDWQRTIELDGGRVAHFDYPFLFPKTLVTKKLQTYPSAPGLFSQSRDRRWLLVQQPGSMTGFELFDLKTPIKTSTIINLPTSLLTKATTSESWQLSEWADDNQHVVLQHLYDGKTEYLLVDRSNPDQSLNLNTTLSSNPSRLTLNDKKYDQYYLYDAATANLQTASLKTPTPTPLLQHVLNYQSYANDTVLYATDSEAPSGKVLIRLAIGNQTHTIRSLSAGTTYLVDLTKYGGNLYVAAGASSENKVYIYKDPVGQLNNLPNHALVPAQVLHVVLPNHLSFSTNAQFIVAENGSQFGVYDIENKNGYNYTTPQKPDPTVIHADWMDGDRLTYVTGGKLLVFDYDDTNQQLLMNASSAHLSAFAPNYKYVYALVPSSTPGQFDLTQTALLKPTDL